MSCPRIKKINSVGEMFGLPKGTVLREEGGRLVGVYYSPKNLDGLDWNIVRREGPERLSSKQVLQRYIQLGEDGSIRLDVPWWHDSHYKKDGGPLHECYKDYSDFLEGIGIPEECEQR